MTKKHYKIIIAGGRDYSNYNHLRDMCDSILDKHLKGETYIEIVSGGAKGADKLGEQYAKERGHSISYFLADWDTHGKKAGYLRNEEMAKYADGLIAFWDGESRGTYSMIQLAHKHKIPVAIVQY